jgi:PAS domain S-box-containing protein
MIAYWDRDLRCRRANRAYEIWFGVAPEALVGRSIRDLLGPELFALNEPYMQRALAGEAQTFERVVPGPDGIARASLAHYIPDRVGDRVEGFVAYVTEVTTLKQAQRDLERAVSRLEEEIGRRRGAEERVVEVQQALALTLASIGAGFVATDRDGRVTRLNASAERILGWREDEARGRVLWDVYQREGRPAELATQNPVDAIGDRAIEEASEVTVVARGGERVPVEVKGGLTHDTAGAVSGLALVLRDLTQLRRAEAGRRQADERFRQVVEASPTGMLTVDRRGHIVYANRRLGEITGYLREELVGQSLDLLIPIGARARHPANVERYLEAPRALVSGRELRARRKDGAEVFVEVGLSPIASADDDVVLATVADISERKRHEEELRRSNADLEQFAYVASHDLQEPLRQIASFTELLAERYGGRLDDRADRYIDFARNGALRMQRLVRDLLTYARAGSSARLHAPVSVASVLSGVLAELGPAIAEAQAVVTASLLPVVMADATQLGQVLQNLVHNALKFRSARPLHIEVGAQRNVDGWLLWVHDTGVGIDPKHADRIFAMFQRLRPRGTETDGGSGIGLAIVKRIVERHGGRVWVVSAVGEGATFYFTLPAPPDMGETPPREGGSAA